MFDQIEALDEAEVVRWFPGPKTINKCIQLACMFNINPYRTFSSTTNKTTVNLPFDHISGKKLAVVAIGTYIGDTSAASSEAEGTVSYFEDSDITNDTVELKGDFRGRDLIIGYVMI